MMDCSSNSSGERGNNSTLSNRKKQISCAKCWAFTFNNYTEDDISSIVPIFLRLEAQYLFSKEIGDEGTPHLQGAVVFKKKIRPLSIGLPLGIHWSKMRDSIKANFLYCAKRETPRCDIFTNVKIPRHLKRLPCEDNMYPWQSTLMEFINQEPDDRTIVWIWEGVGNVGKTTFMKYLMRFNGAIPLEGKKNDILYQVAENDSELYIYDIERSLETFVSYGSIEK